MNDDSKGAEQRDATTTHRRRSFEMIQRRSGVDVDRSTISRQVAAVVHSGYVRKMDDLEDARAPCCRSLRAARRRAGRGPMRVNGA